MYTSDTAPISPDFLDEAQQLLLQQLLHPNQAPPLLIDCSFISDYDMGGGELFMAPKPISEESIIRLDPSLHPMEAAASITPQDLKLENFESLQIDELFDKVLYDSKKDNAVNFPPPNFATDIRTTVPISANAMAPSFIDFPDLDFGAANGDIKTLGNYDISLIQWLGVGGSEDRQHKLSRYRIKKSKRNFGRKIKYVCRKALAETQPRVHGRFAKFSQRKMA